MKNYQKPKVSEAKYWVHEGVKYFVDGKNVILDYSKREKEVAHLIANKLGVHVTLNPRVLEPDFIKTSDYLINGIKFDLKEIEGHGKHVFDNAIKEKKEQATNFIFDITKTKLNIDEIYNRIFKIYKNKQRAWVETLMIVEENKIIDILKRK